MPTATTLFYKPVIYYNDQPTSIHLNDLIDQIYPVKNSQDRTKNVKNKTTWMIASCILDSEQNNPGDRSFSLAINVEDKPFLGRVHTDDIDEIDEDVLELTTSLYFSAYRLLMVQHNQKGCKIGAISDYFNSFLPSDENNSWSVEFIQLLSDDDFVEFTRATQVNKITFQLNLEIDDATFRRSIQNLDREDENQLLLATIMSDLFNSKDQLGGTSSELVFKKGRSNRNPIVHRVFIEALRNLDLDDNLFQGIIVEFNSHAGNKRKVNLIKEGQFKKVIDIHANGWEYLKDHFNVYFFENGRPGTNINCDFPENLIYAERPEI